MSEEEGMEETSNKENSTEYLENAKKKMNTEKKKKDTVDGNDGGKPLRKTSAGEVSKTRKKREGRDREN